MSDLRPVVPGLTQVELGVVNAFLVETDAGLVVVDVGAPGSAPRLLAAMREAGFHTDEVAAVVVTHHHPDHAGALAAFLRATGAEAWMHPDDAAEVRVGNGARPYETSSGVLNWALERLVIRPAPSHYEPAEVSREVQDGGALPGGLVAVHAPGHSRGQIAVHWPARGVLIAADACTTLPVLGPSVIYEDRAEGRRTLRRLAALGAETLAVGHGKPILSGASGRLRERFGEGA